MLTTGLGWQDQKWFSLRYNELEGFVALLYGEAWGVYGVRCVASSNYKGIKFLHHHVITMWGLALTICWGKLNCPFAFPFENIALFKTFKPLYLWDYWNWSPTSSGKQPVKLMKMLWPETYGILAHRFTLLLAQHHYPPLWIKIYWNWCSVSSPLRAVSCIHTAGIGGPLDSCGRCKLK